MPSLPKVVVVLPAFNEAPRIGFGLRVLAEARLVNEVVVVDDGSTDKTLKAVIASAKTIRLPENRGKWLAVREALTSTDGDVYAVISADLSGFGGHDVDGLVNPLLTDPTRMMTVARCNFGGAVPMDGMGEGSIHAVKQNISGVRAYTRPALEVALGIAEEFRWKYPEVMFRYLLEHAANAAAIRNAWSVKEVPFGHNLINPSKKIKWGGSREALFQIEMRVLDAEVYG